MNPATTFPTITETLQCRSEVYEFMKAAEFLLITCHAESTIDR